MKRKLSPAAKKAIGQAAKKRWRTYRREKLDGDVKPVYAMATIDRLGVLLDKFDGTPFELTREQFTERAINWALDRLGS